MMQRMGLTGPGLSGLVLAVLAGVTMLSGNARAQGWPGKPLRVLIPFTAGSATDTIARTVFEQVGRQVGQPAIIESRPGAGGITASAAVARAEPDGHTVLFTSSAYTITPLIQANAPFDVARDLVGVTTVANLPNVMVVPPDRPWKTLPAMIAAAKAKPGSLNYASVGPGSASHVIAELLKLRAGFDAQHVPFKGPTEAITEIVAGRVDFFIVPTLPAMQLIRDGKLFPIAVSSSSRSAELPDVPTTVEAGFPESAYNFWVGALLPAKTPRDIVDRLNREIVKALQTPDVKERIFKLGGEPTSTTPAQFDALIKNELATNAVIVRAAGLMAQ
jgi:tripartite-type tricarboxylate transporter receptor subunit TctC